MYHEPNNQRTRSFDEFIVGRTIPPNNEIVKRITRVLTTHYPELAHSDVVWAAMRCYVLGVIDGKRAERKRRHGRK
jgi:hypothetical protein